MDLVRSQPRRVTWVRSFNRGKCFAIWDLVNSEIVMTAVGSELRTLVRSAIPFW